MTISTGMPSRFLRGCGIPVAAALAFLAAGPAHGQIVINPTYAANINSDPSAAQIKAGILAAINRVAASITNPITVNITFQETSSGLGGSSTSIVNVPYGPLGVAPGANPPTSYLNALTFKQTLSANDSTALATLPNQVPNPVNGTANVTLTRAVARAL